MQFDNLAYYVPDYTSLTSIKQALNLQQPGALIGAREQCGAGHTGQQLNSSKK